MKKIVSFLILLTLLMGSSPGTSHAASSAEHVAVSAAQAWLSLIDDGHYSRSWKEASPFFQGAVSERNWKASLDGIRKPLGKLVFRKIKTVKHFTELPGAPDGQYVVMEFRASFVKKKSAIETVTFALEKDGLWKAAGYFIK
jgi:hypothetical protein